MNLDSGLPEGMNVRNHTDGTATLSVGGWRVGIYKAVGGINRAIDRNRVYAAECAARVAQARNEGGESNPLAS